MTAELTEAQRERAESLEMRLVSEIYDEETRGTLTVYGNEEIGLQRRIYSYIPHGKSKHVTEVSYRINGSCDRLELKEALARLGIE